MIGICISFTIHEDGLINALPMLKRDLEHTLMTEEDRDQRWIAEYIINHLGSLDMYKNQKNQLVIRISVENIEKARDAYKAYFPDSEVDMNNAADKMIQKLKMTSALVSDHNEVSL